MGGFYQAFTSARQTEPDRGSLLALLRAQDPSVGVQHEIGSPNYTLKKSTPWLQGQINGAQNIIDTAPRATANLSAQSDIDNFPLAVRALILALIDQINVLRAALPAPLPPVTPQQALAAIRAKAADL